MVLPLLQDRNSGVNLGRTKRMDATLCGKPKPMLPRAGLHDAGLFSSNLSYLPGKSLDLPHILAFSFEQY